MSRRRSNGRTTTGRPMAATGGSRAIPGRTRVTGTRGTGTRGTGTRTTSGTTSGTTTSGGTTSKTGEEDKNGTARRENPGAPPTRTLLAASSNGALPNLSRVGPPTNLRRNMVALCRRRPPFRRRKRSCSRTANPTNRCNQNCRRTRRGARYGSARTSRPPGNGSSPRTSTRGSRLTGNGRICSTSSSTVRTKLLPAASCFPTSSSIVRTKLLPAASCFSSRKHRKNVAGSKISYHFVRNLDPRVEILGEEPLGEEPLPGGLRAGDFDAWIEMDGKW